MIAKIIPGDRRGTFFGIQSSAANLLASLSAVGAGFILERYDSHLDFAICFLLTSLVMVFSWIALSLTKEPDRSEGRIAAHPTGYLVQVGGVLHQDKNFRWFIVARILSHLGMMGFAFYTVYAVRIHHVSESGIGIMTGILLGAQILAN